ACRPSPGTNRPRKQGGGLDASKNAPGRKKSVRVWAAYALARIPDDAKPDLRLLIDIWKEESDEKERAGASEHFHIAEALDLLGEDARPARDLLLEALLNEKTKPGTRKYVVGALGHLGNDADVIVPKILTLLERKASEYHRIENCKDVAKILG